LSQNLSQIEKSSFRLFSVPFSCSVTPTFYHIDNTNVSYVDHGLSSGIFSGKL